MIVPFYTALLILAPLVLLVVHVRKRYLQTKKSWFSVSDMIAIPDFVSGAMEHWGLITYRETNMLYNAQQASPANQQRVAVVVAHEISHQVRRIRSICNLMKNCCSTIFKVLMNTGNIAVCFVESCGVF